MRYLGFQAGDLAPPSGSRLWRLRGRVNADEVRVCKRTPPSLFLGAANEAGLVDVPMY